MPFHTFFFFHIRGRACGDMCFVPHIKKAYHSQCRMMNIFIAAPLFLIHYSSPRWYRECMCSVIATLGHWLFQRTRLHVNIYSKNTPHSQYICATIVSKMLWPHAHAKTLGLRLQLQKCPDDTSTTICVVWYMFNIFPQYTFYHGKKEQLIWLIFWWNSRVSSL